MQDGKNYQSQNLWCTKIIYKIMVKKIINILQIVTVFLPVVIYFLLFILLIQQSFPVDANVEFEKSCLIIGLILYVSFLPYILLMSLLLQCVNILKKYRMKRWWLSCIIAVINCFVFFIVPSITINGCNLDYLWD